MRDQKTFRKNVKLVLADHRESTSAFLRHLKTLTPSDFARLPRKQLERLSYSQYREVAQAILPDDPLREPEAPDEPTERRRSLGELWATLSVWQRSRVLMMSSMITAFLVVLVGPFVVEMAKPPEVITMSKRAYDWPACQRLTPQTDGCRYTPKQNLRWGYIAAMLGMKTAALRDLNWNLPREYAPAGQPVVVWRSVGKLEN